MLITWKSDNLWLHKSDLMLFGIISFGEWKARLTVVFDPSSADGWMMLLWAEKEYPDR